MAPTYTTTAHGLRWLPGGNLASDIDAGFQALAEDVDTKLLTGGKSIIATSETRANTAYGKLATPDQVSSVVLPTDGLLAIWFHALWHGGVGSATAVRAAIFIGANQLKVPQDGTTSGAPATEAAALNDGAGSVFTNLVTVPIGLAGGTNGGSNASTVTTGMVVGAAPNATGLDLLYELGGAAYTSVGDYTPGGGPVYVWAAAGTYDVSVQFKSATGTVTVKERKLWVRTIAF